MQVAVPFDLAQAGALKLLTVQVHVHCAFIENTFMFFMFQVTLLMTFQFLSFKLTLFEL